MADHLETLQRIMDSMQYPNTSSSNKKSVSNTNKLIKNLKELIEDHDPGKNDKQITESVVNILKKYPLNCEASYEIYLRYIGRTLVNFSLIRSISNFLDESNTVEFDARSGFLSFLLKYNKKVNIIPTDSDPDRSDCYLPFMECRKFNPNKDDFGTLFPECTAVILSWPQFYLRNFMDNLPPTVTKLVIIGEYKEDGNTDTLYTVNDKVTRNPIGVRCYEPGSRSKKLYQFREVNVEVSLPNFVRQMAGIYFFERI